MWTDVTQVPFCMKTTKKNISPARAARSIQKFYARDWLPIAGLPIATDKSTQHNLPKSFLERFAQNDPTYIMHCHDWYELVCVLQGTAIHHVGSRSFSVSRGDIFVIRPNVGHYFSDANDFDAEDIYFIPEQLPLPMEMLRRIPGFNMLMFIEPSREYPDKFKSRLSLNPDQLVTLKNLAYRLGDELSWQPNGFEASAVTLLTEILLLLSRNYNQSRSREERGWLNRISDAILVMERKFAEPIAVEELAMAADTSTRNFQRRFLSLMKTHPVDYLNGIRLRHAAEKLSSSDMHVIDIAHSCGFNDLGYFGRKFHAEYGQSPLQYRKANRTVGGG